MFLLKLINIKRDSIKKVLDDKDPHGYIEPSKSITGTLSDFTLMGESIKPCFTKPLINQFNQSPIKHQSNDKEIRNVYRTKL